MARHQDEQLRIRIERLTATSPACQRFVKQHDELTSNVRLERHIDVIRMGQLMFELGVSKEMDLIDNEAWATMTIEERQRRFIDVLSREDKLPVASPLTECGPAPKDIAAAILLLAQSSITKTPPAAPRQAKGVKPSANTPPENKTLSEPPVKALSEAPPAQPETVTGGPNVQNLEDGTTIITSKVTGVKKGAMKGLGGDIGA